MSDLQLSFEKVLEKHGDQRHKNAVRVGYGYDDDLINHAFHCFELLANSAENSAPKRAYNQWLEANPSDQSRSKVFLEYVDAIMSDQVTAILENKWSYDRNREITHILKCRMFILSGLAASALFE